MSSGERKNRLDEFKEAQVSIMSNARCLTEGVNVPAVDTIAFIDPKESLIDIVQATGRAMRKAQWKEKGYIFIPVVIDEEDDPEEIIETSDFKSVWRVLQSMIDQDQRLESLVSNMRVIQGRGEEKTEAWKAAMSEYSEKIEFFNLPFKIHKARFLNSLYTKTLEIVGRSWDFWYGVTLRFKEQNNGDPNAPRILFEGFKLGSWQSSQRQSYKKKLLSADRIERLNQIGFAWDPHDQLFEKGFQKTLRFKEQNSGGPNVPARFIFEGFKLGSWQDTQRQFYKKKKLSTDRIERLSQIGFIWDQLEQLFEEGFQKTLRFKEQNNGDPNASASLIFEGFKMGSWQAVRRQHYKKKILSIEKIEKLSQIGFVWDQLEQQFEKGFQKTLRFKEQNNGNPNASKKVIFEGYNLGSWQDTLRRRYKNNKLSKERINRLEEIGFKWKMNYPAAELRGIEKQQGPFDPDAEHRGIP
jgi:superfamily II DNA/RNA helicase